MSRSEKQISAKQQKMADTMVDGFELDVMRTTARVPSRPTVFNQVILPRGCSSKDMLLFAAMDQKTRERLHPESFAPGYIEEKKKRKELAAKKHGAARGASAKKALKVTPPQSKKTKRARKTAKPRVKK